MSTNVKKGKKKKDIEKEAVKEAPPQVVTRTFADNTYTGIIREGHLGAQYLESAEAKYNWKDGTTYEGPFVASRIEGKGKFTWPDGSQYEGELHNGKRHGQGVYLGSDGITKYEGQWRGGKCGKRHGQGSYVAPDGTTRYEGQWSDGKRDGTGKLTYTGDGQSFYDGGWRAGKKHGAGKQVWPSGNIYEGEWADGKMSGQGTMTWRTAGTSEQYVGSWEDNLPHGNGMHTWHSFDITLAGGGDGPDPALLRPAAFNLQQQLNNRYEGQWVRGKRHGVGTFYYANGAYYQGEWKDHMKHGRGRHTFEDGTVYEGPFEEDRMLEYTKPPPAEGAELLVRSTDLSDLDAVALPADHGGFELSAGAGYSDHGKIFREVYNMLLRHLGELREIYARYRVLLPVHGADPFSLQAYQFWLFARDAGLLTVACPLPRFDRAVFSGPRHHSETAPEDVPEVRALTPRPMNFERRLSTESEALAAEVVPSAEGGGGGGGLGRPSSGAASQAPSQVSEVDAESITSSAPSPTNAAAAGGAADGGGAGDSPKDGLGDGSHTASGPSLRRGDTFGASSDGLVLGKRFLRDPSAKNVAHTHLHSRHLLFRHFQEAVVRLAPARFPNERGLEAQMHRLFKERILPACEAQPRSEHVFAFLAQREFQQLTEEFAPTLWLLFRSPRAVLPEDAGGEQPPVRADLPSVQRPWAGSAGKRSLHVSARLDLTARVKDVLQLLDRCGLLRAPAQLPLEPLAGAEIFSGPRRGEGDDEDLSADETSSGENNLISKRMAAVDHLMGVSGPAFDFNGIKGKVTLADGFHEFTAPSQRKETAAETAVAEEPGADAAAEQEVSAADLAQCNFSVTVVQALRLLLEVLSPRSLEDLHWLVDHKELRPSSECASVFDYTETEVVFPEFVRLLVQIADRGVRKSPNPALADRLPPAKRFDAFMRNVFLPSLASPYVPPGPEDENAAATGSGQGSQDGRDEAGGGTGGAEDPPASAAAALLAAGGAAAALMAGGAALMAAANAVTPGELTPVPGGAPSPEGAGDEGAGEGGESKLVQPVPELWRGFEGRLPAPKAPGGMAAVAAGVARGARRWPAGYEKEVEAW